MSAVVAIMTDAARGDEPPAAPNDMVPDGLGRPKVDCPRTGC
jgi:hypothetical protein